MAEKLENELIMSLSNTFNVEQWKYEFAYVMSLFRLITVPDFALVVDKNLDAPTRCPNPSLSLSATRRLNDRQLM